MSIHKRKFIISKILYEPFSNPMGFRDHSEGIHNPEGKEIDVDFRRIQKYITNVY